MAVEKKHEITNLLRDIRAGREAAKDELFRLVYLDLQGVASRLLDKERSGQTLQTTDLVHSASIRLVANLGELTNRRHFFAVAARAMRRLLVDHARKRASEKRGRGKPAVGLTRLDEQAISVDDPEFLVTLNDSLERLEGISARKAEVFQLWYFGGLSVHDIAEHLELSERSVQVDLQGARTWLYGEFLPDDSKRH